MSKLPEFLYVSWKEFHKIGFELSKEIKNTIKDIDQIVSISRGGNIPSRILSDFLDLPIFSFSIQSYSSIQEQGELKILQELSAEVLQEHILLVDEVTDSGKTLKRALEYLKELEVPKVTSVSFHVKPHAIIKPDFYADETSKWIIYPYEIKETIDLLIPIWEQAGLKQKDLLEKLTSLGLDQEYLTFFLEKK